MPPPRHHLRREGADHPTGEEGLEAEIGGQEVQGEGHRGTGAEIENAQGHHADEDRVRTGGEVALGRGDLVQETEEDLETERKEGGHPGTRKM